MFDFLFKKRLMVGQKVLMPSLDNPNIYEVGIISNLEEDFAGSNITYVTADVCGGGAGKSRLHYKSSIIPFPS